MLLKSATDVIERGVPQIDSYAAALLNSPALNKGTAFTDEERARLGLNGLLPPQVETLEEQSVRAYEAFKRKDDDLERHIYLRALQDTNEVLFYKLLAEHLEEMMPIAYTPVVAMGCQLFSHIYRRPRGLFISYPARNSIREILKSRPNREVDVMVVTDGQRVLGIGDQGVGGMGISIGKLSLYTLIGGIHPMRTLPVVLDVGTDNAERLADPEYLGWRHKRRDDKDYFAFVEQFVDAVKKELPNTLLHWEDLSTAHARPILERYGNELLTYNDDIQGTAAVTLAAMLAAVSVTREKLTDQQFVLLGAGSSIGVADYLRAAMVQEGLSEAEARSRFWMVDIKGLLHTGRTDLTPDQRVYAQPREVVASWSQPPVGTIGLEEVIKNIDATALIGLSTAGGAFTEAIVREMARKVERPIIFPLSNPTDKSEAKPADLIRWTDGRGLVATGTAFPPVDFSGKQFSIAQCNNAYIFPAVGLGVAATRAWRITDSMMLAAARALASASPALRDPTAPLLPALTAAREVTVEIAVAVAEAAQADGVAPKMTQEVLRQSVTQAQWTPQYPAF
ncbi:NAD-dependent malic enzyme [Edaphobacter sp. HDX4]|uniref:NAD-dependent malic enzyme n=1 Tax=Edaphobacter sp. HDX4 TaxID=2794064 RepID=UPI002FE573C7